MVFNIDIMNKILFMLILACFSIDLSAQDRNVKLPEVPNKTPYRDYSQSNAGYWFAVGVSGGTMIDFNRRDIQYAGVDVVNGYRFNEYIRLGVGLSAKYYINSADVRNTSSKISVPVYMDFRGNIVSQESRTAVPYWSFDIGSALHDGFFFSPTLGMRWGEKRSSFLLGLSYSYNEMDTFKKNAEGRNMISVKLGYEF